ncbi:MAG: SLC13 family permease [Deinococcales bacterium]
MSAAAVLTASVVVLSLAALLFTPVGADLVFAGALTVLLAGKVLTPAQALAGFGNQGLITVGVLYVVAAGLRETGAVYWISQRLLGRPRTVAGAQLRVMAPVSVVSAFLNNTPVVAVMIPAIADWAKKHRLSASKLMLPLSYAAILGGSVTLIGSSTNLIVNGLLLAQGRHGLGLFDLAWVGVPVAVAGTLAVLGLARWLLPDRTPVLERRDNAREYSVEMTVAADGPLVGRTIEQAGLRNLGHVYLVEIDRGGRVLPAVGPSETLLASDRLVFVGVVDSVVDLQRVPGLLPAPDQLFKLDGPRAQRTLVEAVVSDSCPLIGRSIREGHFRSRYGAVVIAVARNNRRIEQKIGDIHLRPGDTLLLETQPDFAERQRNTRDFYLVSAVPDSAPPRFALAPVAGGVLLAMVLAVALGWLPLLTGALLAAALMVIARALPGAAVRRAIDWQVLIVIGCALGVGQAMTTSGLAGSVAHGLSTLAGASPLANLALLYLATALFTALLTNSAAAVLMFPVAASMAGSLHASVLPFAVTLMLAASASFATPVGYQTNLMVLGPGGYRFRDFVRIGLPVTLVTAVVALVVIPLVWPFFPAV